jgi:hypothetical protein
MASTEYCRITNDKGDGTGVGYFTDGTTDSTTIVTEAASNSLDIGPIVRGAFQVVNGAAEDFTFTVQGSIDGVNFSTIAYGTGSSAAYVQTAATVSAGAKGIFFLPDVDVVRYIRLLITASNAANGTVVHFFGRRS